MSAFAPSVCRVQRVDGLRVTDEPTMEVVEMVLGGTINQEIVSLVCGHGGRAVGLTGRDDAFMQAERVGEVTSKTGKKVDIGRVGRLTKVEPEVVRRLVDDRFIPVIAPVAVEADGTSLNVNSRHGCGGGGGIPRCAEAPPDDRHARCPRCGRRRDLLPERQSGRGAHLARRDRWWDDPQGGMCSPCAEERSAQGPHSGRTHPARRIAGALHRSRRGDRARPRITRLGDLDRRGIAMTDAAELLDVAGRVQLGNYRPAPFVMTKGEGVWLEDVDGQRFLDLTGGVAVLSVGHAHPKLAQAIAAQAARLVHVSNPFSPTIARSPSRANWCGAPRSTGCTSQTAVRKRTRRCSSWRVGFRLLSGRDHERVEILATEGSFHGRTLGALSVTGQDKYRRGMGPLLGGVHIVPFDDLEAMREAAGPKTAAILVEPVQGEGGVRVPGPGYLPGLRALADEVGALLLLDEVQTGYGRTGRFLGAEHTGVQADACALAKGIGGGFPLGAMLCTEKVAGGLPYGSHASTYGGNPLACAAGLAVLQIFDDEGLVERAAEVGAYLGDRLAALAADRDAVVEARGLGLLRGLLLAPDVDPAGVLTAVRDRGVLVTLAGGNVVRFAPPLIVRREELDQGVDAVRAILSDPPRLAKA